MPLPSTHLPLSVVNDKLGHELFENGTVFIEGLQPGRHMLILSENIRL